MPEVECLCDGDFEPIASDDPEVITIINTRMGDRIQLLQSASGNHPASSFEYMLRSIRFAHGTSRPAGNYTAFIHVTASDGLLESEVASTQIDVQVLNQAPLVLLDNQTSFELFMRDGQVFLPLLQDTASISIMEDSSIISSLSIRLVNPAHSDERIRLDLSNIPDTMTYEIDHQTLILNGPATPTEFIEAINSLSLEYHYPPMESILQGDVPDFTPR